MSTAILKTHSSKTLAPAKRAVSTRRSTTSSRSARRSAADVDAAAAGLPEAKVKVILRFHLKNLSTSGSAVDDDTVFGDALSDLIIAGMSSRELFKSLSRRDIVRNGGNDKPWPDDWLARAVATLAPLLAG